MSKLSPLSTMGLGGLNFNPNAQKVLLQAAANRKPGENNGLEGEVRDRAGEIPITNFKSNKLSMIDKKQRAEELEEIIKSGKDQIDMKDAIRLPNALKKVNMTLTVDPNAPT